MMRFFDKRQATEFRFNSQNRLSTGGWVTGTQHFDTVGRLGRNLVDKWRFSKIFQIAVAGDPQPRAGCAGVVNW